MTLWPPTNRPRLRASVDPELRLGPGPEHPARLSAAPWQVLGPRPMVELRDPSVDVLTRLRSGTSVALVTDRPGGRRRLRRDARRAGVRIDRELIVLPSTRHAQVVLDDDPAAVRHFWTSVAAVPPGVARLAGPAGVVLRVARRLPWRWTGAVAPGRVLIGSRR